MWAPDAVSRASAGPDAVGGVASDVLTGTFIEPGDPRWAGLLGRARHDVYHLPAYAAVAATHEGGEPCAFYAEAGGEAFLVPLLLRDVPAGSAGDGRVRDATSPYGYPGPICTRPDDAALVARFAAAFLAAGRDAGLVTAFLRLHPLRPVSEAGLERLGTLVRHGPLAYSDLLLPREVLWSQTRPNHRTGIHRLERAGFTVRVDDWGDDAAFRAVYGATMRRVDAAAFYFFPDAYFAALREQLAGALHLFSVVAPDGEVAAAGLFTAVDGIVEYHLGGTSDAHLAQAPSKLMFHAVRLWAKEAGHELLNLGGGLGSSTGPLYNFKAGFARSVADFCTLRVVFDEERYARLSRAAGVEAGAGGDYFPGYRAPRAE
jgi:hypothetical protein